MKILFTLLTLSGFIAIAAMLFMLLSALTIYLLKAYKKEHLICKKYKTAAIIAFALIAMVIAAGGYVKVCGIIN